ncbi:putative winged helix-turn-helix transcription repressor DNA-binding [Rosellinia necatrix]|uniref:Putative winged helix-turn-helix transcription repressor DNA-binding n=1 Tax=Rosellinia necatrix TaxID=77044 RepID=A0A1S7UJA0_ROSNE|nr:putative winged helix-turn-helix transcription repressor DNA-binding [Rosellinia necatrix]
MMSNVPRDEALKGASNIVALLSQGSDPFISEEARVQALQAANLVVRALEKPEDGLMKLAYSPAICMAIRVCMQLNVFGMVTKNETISAAEIAKQANADEVLIRRFLRVLTASGYVAEHGNGLYGPTRWTEHFNSRAAQGMIKFIYDASMQPIAQGPNWFKEFGYQNPVDPQRGMVQIANHTDLPTFKWLTVPENKELWDHANTFFEGDRGSRPSWLAWFPAKEHFFPEGHQRETPLLVDVAGGRGHDLLEFLAKYPDEAGPFVLQDQKPVLDSAPSLPPKVTKQPFDLFMDSPVEGARIYFMKFILHDYMDDQCIQILQNVKTSMVKGYSYLVINDFIIPETGCGLLQSEWDLMMMVLLSSMERTESQWRTLLESAGFSIEGVYNPVGDGQGIIVAAL